MKIFGSTVGTTLPKPSWTQANPKKGDYIKDKPTEMEPVRGYSAYQVACMNGFEGTEAEWLESLKADTEVVVQEIIKEENMETIIHEILKEENTEVIVQEIIKEENIGTIVNEIIKENNLQTIVNEILNEENTEVIVQEILKEENTQVIVEQVMDQVPGHLVVTMNRNGTTASHSAAEIIAHVEKGGSVTLDLVSGDHAVEHAQLYITFNGAAYFKVVSVSQSSVSEYLYVIDNNKVCTEAATVCDGSNSGTERSVKSVSVERNGSVVGVQFNYTDNSFEVATIALDEDDTPQSITINGNTTTFDWSGFDE